MIGDANWKYLSSIFTFESSDPDSPKNEKKKTTTDFGHFLSPWKKKEKKKKKKKRRVWDHVT